MWQILFGGAEGISETNSITTLPYLTLLSDPRPFSVPVLQMILALPYGTAFQGF